MKASEKYLVIGGSGKTGSRVLQGLQSRGLNAVSGSRGSELRFNWDDRSTWSHALQGIDKVYLTYFPDLAVPQAPDDIAWFCSLAEESGVKHITLLSGRGEPAAQVCETIVQQYRFTYTIIRAAWFNQNFSEGLFRPFIVDGELALPVNQVSEPFVDVDDIAQVAIASLTDAKHQGQLYEVTGPELLSFCELADKFSHFVHRPVKFKAISIEQFQAKMQSSGVSTAEIELLTYLFTEVLDGRNERVADGIERALGRRGKSFDEFILSHIDKFKEVA